MRVACWICLAVTGSVSICDTLKVLASGDCPSMVSAGSGSMESPSALVCARVDLKAMSYLLTGVLPSVEVWLQLREEFLSRDPKLW